MMAHRPKSVRTSTLRGLLQWCAATTQSCAWPAIGAPSLFLRVPAAAVTVLLPGGPTASVFVARRVDSCSRLRGRSACPLTPASLLKVV